jgi:transposase InsO family protein
VELLRLEPHHHTKAEERKKQSSGRLLSKVRQVTEDFINEYNEERPHESLGNLTPVDFAAQRAGGTPCPLGGTPEMARSFYF